MFVKTAKLAKLIIIFLFLITSCVKKSSEQKINLNGEWEILCETGNKWLPAKVPGNVHLDLMVNKIIDEPFFNTNSDSIFWVADKMWIYKKNFRISGEFLNRNLELVFEGIDTYSEIFLNSVKLGTTDNMFRRWVFQIPDSLRKENNVLEVKIFPSKKINSEQAANEKYVIDNQRIFSRKAQFQSGWDWSPDFETCGIFKDVYINSWVKLKINNFWVETKEITDTSVLLTANFNITSENYYNANFNIISNDFLFDTINNRIEIKRGNFDYRKEFTIKNPKLWWSNGLGEAFLYSIKFQLNTKFRTLEKEIKVGIRDLKFHNEKDEFGQNFYFELNGIPVFAKGANWVPAEYFSGKNSYKNYKELLNLAKEANFNMLRVWGGGIYENDEFYTICDSLGIMVWQDFMFACAMYPGDSAFLQNVREEADYQINRLKQHPSLVLWCGNNEISNGWFDWGWQKYYNISVEDSLNIWNDYKTIFEKILPDAVSKNDPQRSYISTSPASGWGHKECLTHGDSHYWGIWWGMEPFSIFFNKTGRFMSEYGFQSFPDLKTLKKSIPADSLYLYSISLKTHQKHNTGFETIDEYMKRYFNSPESFEKYVYYSQLLQAEGMQQAFDAHLSEMPYCMGTLFWQFNDCWSAVSWSAVDYYKNPKALYYCAKDNFKQIRTVINKNNDFSVVNHNNRNIAVKAVITHSDFDGKVQQKDSIFIELDKCSVKKLNFNQNNNLNGYLEIQIIDKEKNELLDKRFIINKNIKYLQLPKPKLEINKQREGQRYKITVKSDTFVKSLFLKVDNCNGFLSENYFDLPANDEKVIYFVPKDNIIKNFDLKISFDFM